MGKFKPITSDDVTSTRTLLHESVPITGTIVSGTYTDQAYNERNIKNYSHGMFQSVFDYPYLSSSANHIFDITVGYSAASNLSGATNIQNSKKINIYNQMAQVLVGFDATGSALRFDQNGEQVLVDTNTKIDEVVFLNFSRLLVKDEIKKGSFALTILTGSTTQNPLTGGLPGGSATVIQDARGNNEYKVNSPAGEYGLLYTSSAAAKVDGSSAVGLIYYQAGIAVLTGAIYGGLVGSKDTAFPACEFGPVASGLDTSSFNAMLTASSISSSADGFRTRCQNMTWNNTTELNSTIYFCRVNHNEFNYSSNPTYLTGSKIRVKENTTDEPLAYITTVGLYSSNNELLAVAKLSEPLKKTPSTEFVLKTRLDY